MLVPNGKKYETTIPLKHNGMTVPKGYLTDGITYKFRILGVFINRFDPRFIEAVVWHDYLTDQNKWEEANKVFEEKLPKSSRTARAMIRGVKLYRKYIIRDKG